jgi:hypothetical protein
MMRKVFCMAVAIVLCLAASGRARSQDSTKLAPPSPGPAVTYEDGSLKLTKDISIRLGGLFQPALELQQDLPTASQEADGSYSRRWQHQMFIRRMRLLFGGKVTPAFTFFFDFEAAGIGRVPASGVSTGGSKFSPSLNLLDAQLAYVVSQGFSIMAGQMLIGPTRNGLQGATSLMPVNYGAYTFLANAGGPPNGLDNYVGRDIAAMVRGLLSENRLEYRLSFSDGRSRYGGQAPYSPFRVTARVTYDIQDVLTPDLFAGIHNYYYTGTYFGKKRVVTLGGGIDMQGSYLSVAGDVFIDYPVNEGDGLTLSASYQYLNGGDPDPSNLLLRRSTGAVDSLVGDATAKLVPRTNVLFAEAGYLIKNLNLQPVLKFETKSVSSTNDYQLGLAPLPPSATAADQASRQKQYTYLSDIASESRLGLGLNYVPRGHNVNVKAMLEMVFRTQADLPSKATADNPYPEFKKSYSMFTLQAQWMFF